MKNIPVFLALSFLFVSCSFFTEFWEPGDVVARLNGDFLVPPAVRVAEGPTNSGVSFGEVTIVLEVDKDFGYYSVNGGISNRFAAGERVTNTFYETTIFSYWGSANGLSSRPTTLILKVYPFYPYLDISDPYSYWMTNFVYSQSFSPQYDFRGAVYYCESTNTWVYYSYDRSNWIDVELSPDNGWSVTVPLNFGYNDLSFMMSNANYPDSQYNVTAVPTMAVPRLEIAAEQGDLFGADVDISADGRVLVCGMPGDDRANGSLDVFENSGGQWVYKARLFSSSHMADNMYLGYDVAVSGDGRTVVSSMPDWNNGKGQVQIFNEPLEGWKDASVFNYSLECISNDSGYGDSLDLSADGRTLAVGATTYLNSLGAVFIYTNSGALPFWYLASTVCLTNIGTKIGFACSVALSSNGSTLAIGAMNAGSTYGVVYLVTNFAGVWSDISEPHAVLSAYAPAVSNYLGNSVGISGDGSTVAAGAYKAGNYGAVYVFERAGSVWSDCSEAYRLSQNDLAGQQFGCDVALSGDGLTIVAGANRGFGVASVTGAVYRYRYDGTATQWDLIETAATPDGEAGENYGSSVTVGYDGSLMCVGSPNDNYPEVTNRGTVYFYQNAMP